MPATPATFDRRAFLRGTAGGGISLGGLLGLGFDLRAAQADIRTSKIGMIREVPSVCPYCAVGCGQLVGVRHNTEKNRDEIINIEGNPDSPISQGTLCPKGAATYQLAVNPLRHTKVWYRAPGAKEWDKTKTLEWAMDQIAQRVKATRDRSFVEKAKTDKAGKPFKNKDGQEVEKTVNHTQAIGSLGGATMDNEWNYVQCKLMRALGVINLENQARI